MISKNFTMKVFKQALHGAGAITFATAYLTSDSESFRVLHVYSGYGFGIIFLIRILIGVLPNSSISLQAIWRRATLGKSIYNDLKKMDIKRLLNWQRWYGATMGLIIISMYTLVPPMILAGISAYEELGGRWVKKLMENTHESLGELYLIMVMIHLGCIGAKYLIQKYQTPRRSLII